MLHKLCELRDFTLDMKSHVIALYLTLFIGLVFNAFFIIAKITLK
jgi:hypothetical protein